MTIIEAIKDGLINREKTESEKTKIEKKKSDVDEKRQKLIESGDHFRANMIGEQMFSMNQRIKYLDTVLKELEKMGK